MKCSIETRMAANMREMVAEANRKWKGWASILPKIDTLTFVSPPMEATLPFAKELSALAEAALRRRVAKLDFVEKHARMEKNLREQEQLRDEYKCFLDNYL